MKDRHADKAKLLAREKEYWEDVSHDELDALLDTVDEERAKTFLAVVRGGSSARLEGYYYRIRPRS